MRAKFKAWDEEREIMFQPHLCDSILIHLDGEQNSFDSDGDLIGTRNTKQLTLLLFSGCHDDRNKEIYEGDILRIYEIYGKENPELNEWWDRPVYWNEEGQCLAIDFEYSEYDTTSIGWALEYFDNLGFRYEVIGNIYENPELLEVTAS